MVTDGSHTVTTLERQSVSRGSEGDGQHHPPAPERAPRSASSGPNGRVLVVDDSPEMCEFLEDALGARGFTVRTTRSGDQALALLRAEDFDAVVNDWKLAGMDGIELCERIGE